MTRGLFHSIIRAITMLSVVLAAAFLLVTAPAPALAAPGAPSAADTVAEVVASEMAIPNDADHGDDHGDGHGKDHD